jgi:exportin-2 (importin alpha re-exporter)
MNHLTSRHYVVYTYAAVCIERILAIRSGHALMFNKEDIKPFAQSLLVKLFELVERSGATPEKLAENDYLMKSEFSCVVCI